MSAHPRLTAAQRHALDRDDLAWVGWDVKGRPVITGFVVGRPQTDTSNRWAILRNGQRVRPAWPIVFFDREEGVYDTVR